MTLEELKDEVYTAMVDKPQQWREGQFVFNYIDDKYQVARQIQFQDNVDCFYRDDAINDFLKCAVERINNLNKIYMEEKIYTEKDLVDFGNYLLSEQRNKTIESEEMKSVVGDWDLRNWKRTVDLVEKHYRDNIEEKDKAKAPDIKGEDYSGKRFGYKIPDGYEFDTVDNGKIILKPIKPQCPKTYAECCDILGIEDGLWFTYEDIDYNRINPACISNYRIRRLDLYHNFERLIICRDAYWKIAGEQMGLDKHWEPDWKNSEERRYSIVNIEGDINLPEKTLTKWILKVTNKILVFPTVEMRDAFYENFKDLIEQCKELL